MEIRTNRELYSHLTAIAAPTRDLETFLRALLRLGREHGPREPTATEVALMLTAAATAAPAEPEDAWQQEQPFWPELTGQARFEAILVRQIVDLQRMRQNGQLADDNRYFGLDGPSGARWYNFDPASYLECGTSGSVGGWGDDEVELVTPPAEIAEDDETRRSFGWDGLCDLLVCGQCYE